MGMGDFFSRWKGKSGIGNFSETMADIQPRDYNAGTVGVILTSTSLLAQKYTCSKETVEYVIQKFQNDSLSIGNTWLLCDVSGSEWDYIFKNDDSSSESGDGGVRVSYKKAVSWKLYAEALHDFCEGMELQTTAKTPLLIVGGDDVIPVPMEDIEYKDDYDKKEESMPQVDMKYGFPLNFDLFKELENEKEKKEKRPFHNISDSILNKAKFNVARIPLESGRLRTDIQEDLGCYFDKVITSGKSVSVNSAVACAAEIFAGGAENITLPLPLVDDNIKLSNRKLFTSPPVDFREGDTAINIVYKEAISKADLFFSDLHGAAGFNSPEYSGQPGDDTRDYPPAFSPEELKEYGFKLKVILSLSCYGARYIEYARDVSTLLTAMYDSRVLLFMGSSQPAWGAGGIFYTNPTCSQCLMQTYIMYLIEGEPAGYALLKAKLDYFDKNYAVDANYAYLTIVEFNLFGDPTLHVKFPPRSIQNLKASFSTSVITKKGPYTGAVSHKTIYNPNNSVGQNHGNYSRSSFNDTYERIKNKSIGQNHENYSGNSFNDIYERIKNKNTSFDNIYENVHSAVDANLRNIEQQLMMKLFGKNSRDHVNLAKIDEIYVNGTLNGYRYLFETGTDSFRQQTVALVDKNGNIINSMRTI